MFRRTVSVLPEFRLPEGYDSFTYLKKLCDEGYRARYGDDDSHRRQLAYEQDMIEKMGFTDYFLIVSDFVNYARRAGIPVARDCVVEAGSAVDPAVVVADLGEELFVKPAVNGSSYGVSFVHGADELLPAIERAAEHGGKVIVEQRLVGTEITVGVYDAPDWLRALPVVEIRKQENAEFYDLNVKYIDPSQVHRIPAQIAPEDYARAQELACRAHEALGCTGFSRSDFIVTENGPVILETNTIPGMTDTSLYPDEVRHAGMAFSDVCARLVELALDGTLAHHLDDAEVPADLAEGMYPQLWGQK